jgi:hypothetical protein
MEDFIVPGLAGAAGLLAFFGGIALIVLAGSRGEGEKRKAEAEKARLDHEARMRALELGRPLPDLEVARVGMERTRVRAAAVVAWLVPWGAIGAAVGTTAILLDHYDLNPSLRAAAIFTVWGVAGILSIVTVNSAARTMRHAGRPPEKKPPRKDEADVEHQEQPPREPPAPPRDVASGLELREIRS